MKARLKSALIRLCLAGFCLSFGTIAACSDDTIRLPHVMGSSEVPDDVLNEPRLVTTALPHASDQAAWPRVGDVPFKPKDFTPLPLIDQSMTEMENDRTYDERRRGEVEGTTVAPLSPAGNGG